MNWNDWEECEYTSCLDEIKINETVDTSERSVDEFVNKELLGKTEDILKIPEDDFILFATWDSSNEFVNKYKKIIESKNLKILDFEYYHRDIYDNYKEIKEFPVICLFKDDLSKKVYNGYTEVKEFLKKKG
jgi:hypothetical protein